MTTSTLRVAFDEPEDGWLKLELRSGEREWAGTFSHVYPSLPTMCDALCDLASERVARPVVFLLEPAELELRLSLNDDGTSTLNAVRFPDRRRDREGDVVFQHSAPVKDVVLSFWRALRRLETCLPATEFAARWRQPFPSAAMAVLTSVVRTFETDGRRPMGI